MPSYKHWLNYIHRPMEAMVCSLILAILPWLKSVELYAKPVALAAELTTMYIPFAIFSRVSPLDFIDVKCLVPRLYPGNKCEVLVI